MSSNDKIYCSQSFARYSRASGASTWVTVHTSKTEIGVRIAQERVTTIGRS
jgi:hypothetical protein